VKDTTFPFDPPEEVTAAVNSLMPRLRRLALGTIALISAVVFGAFIGTIIALNSGLEGSERGSFVLLVLVIGGLAVVHCYRWMIRRQNALVMPILAQAVGLSYGKHAKPFINAIPQRLLPKGRRVAEGYVHGKLGPYAIQMARIEVETGGDAAQTLFKGIVAQFPTRVSMPAFFLALEDKTRPGFFSSADLKTEGLDHLRNVWGGSGRTYGVWTSRSGRDFA
jgi:hypothetical protein